MAKAKKKDGKKPGYRNTPRDEELSNRPRIRDRLLEIFADVEKGFEGQKDRADNVQDYWDFYNCVLGDKQFYYGNSKIFVPIIHTAVKARTTRFTNQLFPRSGRNVQITDEVGDIPHSMTALMEHYIRRAKLKTLVAKPLIKNGDIEGHYWIYCTWSSIGRYLTKRTKKYQTVDGMPFPGLDDYDDVETDVEDDEGPEVIVLNDTNVCVLPVASDTIDQAVFKKGGSATVLWQWTKPQLKRLIKGGVIDEDAGEALVETMTTGGGGGKNPKPITKQFAEAAGIRDNGKYVNVYETWTTVKVDGRMRLVRAFYGGAERVLGCKLCPFWTDRIPIMGAAVDKVSNEHKGVSLVKPCVEMQVFANDMINEGADSATFAMMPIVMTDPTKNPRTGTMVMALAAVWETSPNDTRFAQFPQLWKDAFSAVAAAKNEIFQLLSVNPAMLTQQTGMKGSKRNQAEIAMEQSIDILSVSDACSALEDDLFGPLVERFIEMDAQFRTTPITVEQYGMLGVRAKMEEVEPQQVSKKFCIKWMGVEAARNAAQVQQMIAAFNVIRGIPPQFLKGYSVNAVPLVEHLVESAFGPRVAPNVFQKLNLSLDPDMENGLLWDGFSVPVSPMDDDQKHIASHMEAKQQGDPHGTLASHIMAHQIQLQAKAAQASAPGMQGAPGGARQSGIPGSRPAATPRIGAQPGQPRPQGPPGMFHRDQLARAGSPVAPRKTA